MTNGYANQTSVSVQDSKAEIERTLIRFGATSFMSAWDEKRGQSAIQFDIQERRLRFVITMPCIEDYRVTPERRLRRSDRDMVKAYEQAIRSRWRELLLVVKAKLAAVQSGIVTFEDEFMSYMVLPDNTTVGEYMLHQIARAYELKEMPSMLPMLTDGNNSGSRQGAQ